MRAARTDKGVHAIGQVVSLKMILDAHEDIVGKINEFLPSQIRVWGRNLLPFFNPVGYIRTVSSFHCKNFCDSRIYEYILPTFVLSPLTSLDDQKALVDDQRAMDQEESRRAFVAPSPTPEELELYKSFRISEARLEAFRDLLKKFEGTRNFHNYTSNKGFEEANSIRHILNISVNSLHYYNLSLN